MSGVMDLEQLAILALEEDRWTSDCTTRSVQKTLRDRGYKEDQQAEFYVHTKQDAIFAGAAWARVLVDRAGMEMQSIATNGEPIRKGQKVVLAHGPWTQVLAVERTLLNGLQYFCGIATQTRRYVDRVGEIARLKQLKNPPRVYHTRKILPLLREPVLDAVRAGGGCAHRRTLADRILFKDNHKYVLQALGLTLQDYASKLKDLGSLPDAMLEVENLDEALLLARAGVRHLLLDNFTPEQIIAAVDALKSFELDIEISGGLSLEHLHEYVIEGVSRLSIGALTHSIPAVDLSLDFNL